MKGPSLEGGQERLVQLGCCAARKPLDAHPDDLVVDPPGCLANDLPDPSGHVLRILGADTNACELHHGTPGNGVELDPTGGEVARDEALLVGGLAPGIGSDALQ